MKRGVIAVTVVAGLVFWNCTRTFTEVSLKDSVEGSAAKINEALSVISETKGYQLMTMTGDLTKSGEEGYLDSITLDLVAGVYEFKPDTFVCHHMHKPFWVFEKTGESDMMEVSLPQAMIFHPRYLFYQNIPDTIADNNFRITASDYHFLYTFLYKYDYKLTAGLSLEDEEIGTMDVTAKGQSFADKSYSSAFSFTDDYSIIVARETGDTTISSFGLYEGDETLLAETIKYIWKDWRMKERQYKLTIGNVDIVKTSGIDSIQVFLDGVLQQNAAAVITDSDESDNSICHHRDILLTFDDGTTVKLSELIEPAMTTLKSLVGSMHEMYFARKIVDYIALSIYYHHP